MGQSVRYRDIMNPDMSFYVHNTPIRDVALYNHVGIIEGM